MNRGRFCVAVHSLLYFQGGLALCKLPELWKVAMAEATDSTPSAPQLWALSHVAMKTHQSLLGTLQGRTGDAGFTKGSSCNNRAIHNHYVYIYIYVIPIV